MPASRASEDLPQLPCKVVWPWSCIPHLLGLQDHHVTCVHNDRTSCTMWLIESSRDIIKSSTYTHLAQCQVANSPPYCLILIVLCAIASVVVSFCHCSDNYWCRSQEVQPLVSPVYLAHYPHLHILLSLCSTWLPSFRRWFLFKNHLGGVLRGLVQ
jgi:hypothetical protein